MNEHEQPRDVAAELVEWWNKYCEDDHEPRPELPPPMIPYSPGDLLAAADVAERTTIEFEGDTGSVTYGRTRFIYVVENGRRRCVRMARF